MTESFLHYIWTHKLLQGKLVTNDGLPVVVERPGEHNHDAGPDFIDARLKIGDQHWAGNVEIHVKSSDWNLHHHSQDKNYNSVVLHVVYDDDTLVQLPDGRTIPTLVIRQAVPASVWEGYAALMKPALPIEIPCMLHLPEISDFLLNSFQDRLAIERLERKSDDVARLLDEARGNWDLCCYWLLSRYFGSKVNAFQFELLAKNTPQRLLAKIKSNPVRVEALFMGQAGLLEGEFDDAYAATLQKEYHYLRVTYNLTPMPSHLWKFFRLRPSNFPTLRISQLAQLVVKSQNLFSHLLDTTSVNDLRQFFDLQASEYWQTHYRFGVPVEQRPKRAGDSFVDMLLINAWVPLLFQYGLRHGDESCKDRAIDILQQLPPEHNRIVRLWDAAGLRADNAARSQAQIQLYNEYCKSKNCLQCQIGYQVLVKSHVK